MKPTEIKYKRVLLKLTGELFGGGEGKKGIDFTEIKRIATYIHELHEETKIEFAIVIGAGNLLRARELSGTSVDRVTADYIGMLGTIMNALALQEELEKLGSITRVMSSLSVQTVCEPFIKRRAIRHLEKGRIVILAGGTGNPFFTTDSAAALKACELNCEILLKASNIDGVFNIDPKIDKNAKLYERISFELALKKGLTVMDNTAFSLCQQEKIPIIVFNISSFDNIEKILRGEKIGTLIN